jgi:hypothetical protein
MNFRILVRVYVFLRAVIFPFSIHLDKMFTEAMRAETNACDDSE